MCQARHYIHFEQSTPHEDNQCLRVKNDEQQERPSISLMRVVDAHDAPCYAPHVARRDATRNLRHREMWEQL